MVEFLKETESFAGNIKNSMESLLQFRLEFCIIIT